jgi:hypothetical protein
VHYSKGVFYGVVLDTLEGKNNGTVKDVTYFTCEDGRGLMVKEAELRRA